MDQAIMAVFGAGALALVASIVLLLLFRFERFVGIRYLRQTKRSRTVRIVFWTSLATAAIWLVIFLVSRNHNRTLATIAVSMTLAITFWLVVPSFLLQFLSVFTTVSAFGIFVGVSCLIVVLSVTSGFQRVFQEKVLAVNAHLIITAYGIERDMAEAEHDADEIMKKLKTLPGVTRMSKFSFSGAEVMIGRTGANLKGIDLGADPVPELRQATLEGSVDDLARPARNCGAGLATTPGRIFLGAELARRARVKVGDCLNVLVPFSSGSTEGTPSAFPFEVVGRFQMGFNEYDSRLAFVSLDDARRLGNARQSVFGVEVRFRDPMMALQLQDEVERRIGPEPRIIDWKTLNHNLFTALDMQKVMIALIIGILIVVAAVNIVSSLTLIVLSKYREVAVLGSMGARKPSLLRIFLVAGSFVGFTGISLGILFGLAVCGLARLYGYPLDPKVYLIAQLPVAISWREILFVAATTQLICVVVTLYPALRAARLKVVDGLRYI